MNRSYQPYHMFVSDIDGTLIGPDGVVSEANRAAIQELRNRGIPVVLATGRTWGGTADLWEELGLDEPVILCNGAQVYDPRTGRMLWDRRLSREEMQAAEQLLRDQPVHVYAVVSDRKVLVHHPRGTGSFTAFNGDRYVPVEDVFAELDRTGVRPIKLFVLAEPALVPSLVAMLRTEGRLNAVQSESYAFDVVPHQVSKAEALDALLGHRSLSPQRVVAVGNAPNDIDMLRYVGLGVAVGDAHPDVLAVADHVTAPCAEDGVARAVASVFAVPLPGTHRSIA